uniref:Uncharacterized protein n=1 Tax=Timema tahoe TaxID=61484 RepID=A0A7R9IIZ3_9NEOP|nr:unnamed protein product [Timema tahoe]
MFCDPDKRHSVNNAAVEQSFSVNKRYLVENLHENSLFAQRVTYDAVTAAGGLLNMTISKKMIHAVKNASGIREEALEKKKKIDVDLSQKRKTTSEEIRKLEVKSRTVLEKAREEAEAFPLARERSLESNGLYEGCNISGWLVQSPAAGFCLYKSNWRLSLNGEPPWTADSTCHCLSSCDRGKKEEKVQEHLQEWKEEGKESVKCEVMLMTRKRIRPMDEVELRKLACSDKRFYI